MKASGLAPFGPRRLSVFLPNPRAAAIGASTGYAHRLQPENVSAPRQPFCRKKAEWTTHVCLPDPSVEHNSTLEKMLDGNARWNYSIPSFALSTDFRRGKAHTDSKRERRWFGAVSAAAEGYFKEIQSRPPQVADISIGEETTIVEKA